MIRPRGYEQAVEEDYYAFHERQVGTNVGKTLKALVKSSFEKGLKEVVNEVNVVKCDPSQVKLVP